MAKQSIHRTTLIGLLLGFLLSTAATAQETPAATRIEPPQSVLFLGNSLTMYNNAIYTHLRGLLVAVDPAAREQVFLKSIMINGAVLADHRGGLMKMLAARDWDVVVLQGHSREALDERMAEGFTSTAREFAGIIRSKDSEPVLFMTWAYASQPGMTARLAEAYAKLGGKLGLRVVPVGLAFEQAGKDIPGLSLYVPDGIHPTMEGTYLAASVFYAALFGASPLDIDYDAGLDAGLARQLREVAWRTVRKYISP